MTRGKLIVVEGMDGGGKTTQANLIEIWCNTVIPDQPVVRLKEPGSSFDGAFRSMLFEQEYSKDLNQVTAGLLFFLDHYNTALAAEEAVAAGKTVLCDRWCYSQYAYDSVKHSSNVDSLALYRKYEEIQIKPDLVLLFETDPETATARLQARTDKKVQQSDKQWGDREDLNRAMILEYRELLEKYHPTRSQQRRHAAMAGKPAPQFDLTPPNPVKWALIVQGPHIEAADVFERMVEPRLVELFYE